MPEDPAIVRRIAWHQVCPWLMIFRSFRLSISLPVLFLATVGVLLTPLGWRAGQWLFLGPLEQQTTAFPAYVDHNRSWPTDFTTPRLAHLHPDHWYAPPAGVGEVYWRLTAPFRRLLDPRVKVTECAYLLFGGLWTIALWGFLGGAITRLAAVQLGRQERIGFRAALRHARRNYFWYCFAPLFPLLGMLLAALPLLLLGFLMRLDAGIWVAAVLWPLMLLFALAMTIFLLGVLLGWPLMLPTISSEEGSDSFEAFSRSFSYTFQRPLHYLFYALVVALFGALCWLLVRHFADALQHLAYWAAAWGAGNQRLSEFWHPAAGELATSHGANLLRFSHQLVDVIAAAFNFGFFWCASTAVYLLLRRDVDQTDFDEVFVEEESGRYVLPPLPTENPPPTNS